MSATYVENWGDACLPWSQTDVEYGIFKELCGCDTGTEVENWGDACETWASTDVEFGVFILCCAPVCDGELVEVWGDACEVWGLTDVEYGTFVICCEVPPPTPTPSEVTKGYGRGYRINRQRYEKISSGQTRLIKVIVKIKDEEFIEQKLKGKKIKVGADNTEIKIVSIDRIKVNVKKDK